MAAGVEGERMGAGRTGADTVKLAPGKGVKYASGGEAYRDH